MAGFVSAADNWFVSPSLSPIASDFGVSVARAGTILTAYMIPYGLMQPVYGFFADKWSKIKLLRLIVFGLAVGTAGSALSSSFAMLCALRVVTGFFAAGIIAVSLALIGDVVPEGMRQSCVGCFMGIVFTGQGLSAGLGGALAKYASWRGAFLFFAAAAFASTLLLNTLDEQPIPDRSKRRDFLRQTVAAAISPLGRVIFPVSFAAGFILLGMYGYIGAFLNKRVGLDYMQSGMLMMSYGFAALLMGAAVGPLARRFGKKRVVVTGECWALVAALLLCLGDVMQSWPAVLASTMCLGFGYISIQSTMATLAFEVAGACRGLPSGMIGLCLFCGGGLGSLAGGGLLAQGSYRTVWLAFGAAIILLTIASLRLRFDARSRVGCQ